MKHLAKVLEDKVTELKRRQQILTVSLNKANSAESIKDCKLESIAIQREFEFLKQLTEAIGEDKKDIINTLGNTLVLT